MYSQVAQADPPEPCPEFDSHNVETRAVSCRSHPPASTHH